MYDARCLPVAAPPVNGDLLCFRRAMCVELDEVKYMICIRACCCAVQGWVYVDICIHIHSKEPRCRMRRRLQACPIQPKPSKFVHCRNKGQQGDRRPKIHEGYTLAGVVISRDLGCAGLRYLNPTLGPPHTLICVPISDPFDPKLLPAPPPDPPLDPPRDSLGDNAARSSRNPDPSVA